MGRPREFDKAEVLDAAIQVFWTNGYESTSMVDLMAAMDLHKGSIYKAFGDKHHLFMAALGHYMSQGSEHMQQAMQSAESPKEAVREFALMALQECSCGTVVKGCFMLNTVVELAPHDEEVKSLIGAFMEAAKKNLADLISKGQSMGQFRTDKTAEELATYLMFVKAGLLTASKINLKSQDPFAVVELALQTLE